MRFLTSLAVALVCVTTRAAAQSPAGPAPTPATPAAAVWVPPPPTPNEVRGLPPCRPGQPLPAEGEAYTCRPSFAHDGLRHAIQLSLALGWADAETELLGNAFSFAAGYELGLTRAFGLGLRYQFIAAGDAGVDGPDEDRVDDDNTANLTAHLLGVGPRLRLFTDETAREAWILEADGGYALMAGDGGGPSGPYVRAALGRHIGYFYGTNEASSHALVLEYLQGFADASDFRALLLQLRFFGLEWGVPEPGNIDREPEPAGFDYTFGIRWLMVGSYLDGHSGFGISPGVGLTFGLPVSRGIEPRFQVDVHARSTSRADDAPFHFTGLAGLRVRALDPVQIWLEGLAGYSAVVGTTPRDYDSGPIVEIGAGAALGGCGGGGGVGVHYRRGLAPYNDRDEALFFTLSVEYGSRPGSLGEQSWDARPSRCGSYQPGTVASRPVAPPPLVAPPPAAAHVEVTPVLPDVEAHVEIAVEPVIVEVSLGVALFGGMVRVEVDPSALPLAQIRESGYVSVEIVGPARSLARAEGRLRAALGPDGGHVEGFTRIEADQAEVRAIFTIWPPGTRPAAE